MRNKICFSLVCYLLCPFFIFSQPKIYGQIYVDSLKKELQKSKEDTNRVKILIELIVNLNHEREASIQYAKEAIAVAQKIHFKVGEGKAYFLYAGALQGKAYYGERGSFEEVISNLEKALEIFKSIGYESEMADTYRHISHAYLNLKKDFPTGYKYAMMGLKIHEKLGEEIKIAYVYEDLATFYSNEDNRQEQINMLNKALTIYENLKDSISLANINIYIGAWHQEGQGYDEALQFYIKANKIYQLLGTNSPDFGIPWSKGKIADIYLLQADKLIHTGNKTGAHVKLLHAIDLLTARMEMEEAGKMSHRETYPQLGYCHMLLSKITQGDEKQKNLTEGLKYYQLSLQMAKVSKSNWELAAAYEGLMSVYDLLGNYKMAYESQRLFIVYRDSAEIQKNDKQILEMKMQYAFENKNAILKAEQDKKDAETKRIRNLQYSAIVFIMLLATFLFWNSRQKSKAKIKIEKAYSELKQTQAQLIQAEKMASLGELTAGIAHEIQNPLNFVNNFSEVSTELIKEMVEEVDKGNTTEVKAIAGDLVQNLEKINHHGKRADAIVKGMLQHSRSSSGQKEPTDINALCDEYLRLAYHGLRAKDQSFNATLNTDYDERIDKINVVPQDIGRVVLNLITNAFYAVSEKKKQNHHNYEPTLSVSTKSFSPPLGGRGVNIIVSDNGLGIPTHILDKIFQPFFTTKPTGQGTGLGLSLSYDIVKTYGGDLKVETKEGEGTTFTIQLPIV